jgi:hypothetical protein
LEEARPWLSRRSWQDLAVVCPEARGRRHRPLPIDLEDQRIDDAETRDPGRLAQPVLLGADDLVREVLVGGAAGADPDEPLERVFDVVRCELPPVVEADAPAEIEGDASPAVGAHPVLGQGRDRIKAAVELDQTVKKLLGDEVVGREGRVEDLIEGGVSALDPDSAAVTGGLARFLRAQQGRNCRDRGRGQHDEQE